MATIIPSPNSYTASSYDGTLPCEFWDAVAVWRWEAVLMELSEVPRVRGDREVEAVMMVVTAVVETQCDADEQEGGGVQVARP